MNKDEVKQLFDQQALNYDNQWRRMAPINNGLYFFLESIFSVLPVDANILCVGAGTGKELLHLAQCFPKWRFTVVEPSGEMINICRNEIEKAGFTARCDFHEGYLDTLPKSQNESQSETESEKGQEPFHGATCFLVSQFILNENARSDFFKQIATKLKPGGLLVSSDLAADIHSKNYENLLELWLTTMSVSEVSAEAIQSVKAAYSKDVAVLPPNKVAEIIKSGGFDTPIQFYQAGMIHAFLSKRI